MKKGRAVNQSHAEIKKIRQYGTERFGMNPKEQCATYVDACYSHPKDFGQEILEFPKKPNEQAGTKAVERHLRVGKPVNPGNGFDAHKGNQKFSVAVKNPADLDLIGKMAAAIGHEIRNPLTVVRGFLQVLGTREECERYKDYFGLMLDELDRANAVLSDLLTLADNKVVNYRVLDINDLIEQLLPSIKEEAMQQGQTVKTCLGCVAQYAMDADEIAQLILQLVRNGIESMKAGGELIICTYMDQDTMVFSVEDQGEGIPLQLRPRIAEPFLTTRESGHGLGLAVCHRIASRHNASIEADSGGSGSTFYVRFRPTENHSII